jgi:hypothetical protein
VAGILTGGGKHAIKVGVEVKPLDEAPPIMADDGKP